MAEENKNDFIKWFNEVKIEDVPSVGGKNAALGEMFRNLVDNSMIQPFCID